METFFTDCLNRRIPILKSTFAYRHFLNFCVKYFYRKVKSRFKFQEV